MKISWLAIAFVTILVVASCNPDDAEVVADDQDDVLIAAYIDTAAGFEKGDDGIYYRQLSFNPSGARVPEDGQILSIQYTLSLLGETPFTSATDSTGVDSLVVLKQGAGAIYPAGLDLALDTMSAGEEWEFILPSALAFGNMELVNIPAKAILLVHIRLLDVQTEGDVHTTQLAEIQAYVQAYLNDTINPVRYLPQGLGMGYKLQEAGSETGMPQPSDTVNITCTIRSLEGETIQIVGSVVDPFEFYVDQEPAVFLGLNAGVKQMTPNEEAILIIPSAAGYDYSAAVVPNYVINHTVIPPEENPLILNKIIPPYAAYVQPYEILLVEIHLRSVNN